MLKKGFGSVCFQFVRCWFYLVRHWKYIENGGHARTSDAVLCESVCSSTSACHLAMERYSASGVTRQYFTTSLAPSTRSFR